MRDPVSTADGHTYERTAIENWFARNDTSPKTGATLAHKGLAPNLSLRQAIEEWQEAYSLHVRRADFQLVGQPLASGSFKTVYRGRLRVHVPSGRPKEVPVAVLQVSEIEGRQRARKKERKERERE